jgi:predicted transcriptional regulator of viral defense system
MKDFKIIGKILLEKGRITTTAQLTTYLNNYADINKKISSLIDKGLLVKLKKGTYYIAKIGSLGYTSTSNYIISNAIGEKSFVSFEGALKYLGVFDQGIKKYRAISLNQYLSKELEDITYEYVKVKENMYFGFNNEKVDGGNARIATLERALLDILEYKRSINTVSIVLEKLNLYKSEIKFSLLYKYARNYSQTTVKTLGLLLDLVEVESSQLEKLINKKSTSHMSNKTDKFSNKWRLYYNSAIEKQLDD